MNFLAHLHLAPAQPQAWIGALWPDLVPARQRRDLSIHPPLMQAAIRQHYAIDAFTDTHPLVVQSKERLREGARQRGYERYLGILMDVFYDHLLTRAWTQHHDTDLPAFIARVYAGFTRSAALVPPGMRPPLERMMAQDWLGCYATLDGLDRVLGMMSGRLAQRLGREVDLSSALADLPPRLAELDGDFALFYPQLRRAVALDPLLIEGNGI